MLFTRLGLSAWRWVSLSILSSAPGRHEMRDEQELSLPHCTHGERLQEASQLVGSKRAASGTGAPGLGRDCVPRLAVAQKHHPGTGTLGLGTAILEKEQGGHWRVAAIPVASLEACEEQAEVVSHWWASAGKGNTSLTACLSSASAAKYPPRVLGQLHNGEQRPNQKYSQPRRSGSRH